MPPLRNRLRPTLEQLESRELLATLTVTNTNDSGPGSLRQAVLDSNRFPGQDTITFDENVTGRINLTSGELGIFEQVDIHGPGADKLEISATNRSRIFHIQGGGGRTILQDLNLNGGYANTGDGAVIRFNAPNMVFEMRRTEVVGGFAGGRGGGLWIYARLAQIRESTFASNQSIRGGAAITAEAGEIWIVNSTFSSNNSVGYPNVAEIANHAPDNTVSTMHLRNVTIADSKGHALSVTGDGSGRASAEVGNSLFARIEGGFFLGTPGSVLIHLGNNLFDWSDDWAADGDIVGVDPGISTSLGRNGGSTRSYSFIDPSTSPAIDAGNNDLAVSGSGAALATDQRQAPFSRIVDGNGDGTSQVDIGAVEHQKLHVTSTADFVDGNYSQGEFTLREAVQLSELLPGTQTISFGTSGPVQLANAIEISDSVIIAGNQTQIRAPAVGNAFAIQSDNSEPNEYQFYDLRISGGESNLSGIVFFGAEQGDRLIVRGSTIEGFSLRGAAGIADLSLPQVVQVDLRDTNLRGNFYGLLAEDAELTYQSTHEVEYGEIPLRTEPQLGSRSEFGHNVEHVLTNFDASTFARVYTDVPFSNPANPMDVDGDGFVSPRDALLPINELNQGKSGLLEPPTDNAGIATHLYIDPSKDNFLSPIDALLVINFLNQAAGQGEGEGEHDLEYLPPADVCLPKSDALVLENSRAFENAVYEHWLSPHSQELASSNVGHHDLASFIGPRPFSAQADGLAADADLDDSNEPEMHDWAIASMDLELPEI